MTAVWLALLASGSWGVADFLGGLTTRGHSVFKVLAVSQPAGLVLLTVALLVHGSGVALTGSALWAVAAGLASVASLGCLYVAMARGDMILVAPVAATGVVIPVVAGIEEHPVTAVTAAGMVLAVVGAIATTWSAPEPTGRRAGGNAVAVLFALGSAAGQGLFLLSLSRATDGDPYSATWLTRVVSCAVTLAVYAGYRRRLARRAPAPVLAAVAAGGASVAEPAPDLGPGEPAAPGNGRRALVLLAMPAVGCADAVAEIAFAGATTSGALSIAAVLSSLYPVGTMLLAVVFLGERARFVQGLGAVCALVGVVLLSAAV